MFSDLSFPSKVFGQHLMHFIHLCLVAPLYFFACFPYNVLRCQPLLVQVILICLYPNYFYCISFSIDTSSTLKQPPPPSFVSTWWPGLYPAFISTSSECSLLPVLLSLSEFGCKLLHLVAFPLCFLLVFFSNFSFIYKVPVYLLYLI